MVIVALSGLTFPILKVNGSYTETKGFEALSYTETWDYTSTNYAQTWNSTTASPYIFTETWNVGGQLNFTGYYQIWRTFMYFDTSVLPNTATINSAVLRVYVTNDNTTGSDFNLTLQSGLPTYPSIPSVSSDFYQGYYSGNGGSRNTSDSMAINNWWNISLSASGLTWINLTDTTKFALRSDRDISATAPTSDEFIVIDSYSSAYPPTLYVTYTITEVYTYITRGTYYENGTIPAMNTTITLFKNGEPSETRTLTSTSGVEGVQTWYTTSAASYFIWNISLAGANVSRSYWLLPTLTFENIYIFIPDPDTIVNQYSFTVNDISGMTNAFLESSININGFPRLVERKSVDAINPDTFWMSQFTRYGLTIVCDQGTYDYAGGFEAGTEPSNTITVSKFSFPIVYNYFNISVSGSRANTTYCQLYYNDLNAQTYSLNISIVYLSGQTWTILYTSITTSQTTTLSYASLDPGTDYIGQFTANRTTGVYTWNVPLPLPNNMSRNIFDSLNSLFPDSPIPPSNFLGLFILFSVFAIFTFIYIDLAMFLVVILNAVFDFIGMMQTPVTILSLAMVIVVFVSIKKAKAREREL
jgi:hypothetical protein